MILKVYFKINIAYYHIGVYDILYRVALNNQNSTFANDDNRNDHISNTHVNSQFYKLIQLVSLYYLDILHLVSKKC